MKTASEAKQNTMDVIGIPLESLMAEIEEQIDNTIRAGQYTTSIELSKADALAIPEIVQRLEGLGYIVTWHETSIVISWD